MTRRKILMISLGQCGNAVATAFSDQLLSECGVGANGEPPADAALAEALTMFCDQQTDGRLFPRRLLAATSPHSLSMGSSRYAGLVPAEAKILEMEVDTKNWAKGYNAPTVETLVHLTRDRIAALDGNCIIWLFHALGGGYGSGAGSRFLETMIEEYGGTIPVVSIAVAPATYLRDTMSEPYNTVLALKRLINNVDQVLLFDNEAVVAEIHRLGTSPVHQNLNAIIGTALCTLASPLLWPDADGRRMSAEELHTSFWPAPTDAAWEWASADAPRMMAPERFVALTNCYEAASPADSAAALGGRLAQGGETGLLSATDSGRWTKMFAIFQGPPGDADGFAQAIPGGQARLSLDPSSGRMRAIAVGGHTALAEPLKRVAEEFNVMFRRKALLHAYTGEEMDESEFTEAESTLSDAIDEFMAAAEE